MIKVKKNAIHVETKTLKAVIEKGFLTSLTRKPDRREFIEKPDIEGEAALQLVYRPDEAVGLGEERFGSINCIPLSEHRAEIRFHCWDGDGVIKVSEDLETGDLLVEPSAYSLRAGVLACRWLVAGLGKDLQLVAPLFQGVKMKLDDPLLRERRRAWPFQWEAGLAILEGKDGGFWVHTQDEHYRYKALKTGIGPGGRAIAFDTEAYGPVDDNLSAGGLTWRVNVFEGDWKVPAALYRDWLWRAFGLEKEERKRPEWIQGLRMAISWCPCDMDILDALAKKVEPKNVLLHVPRWRTDGYDENYPTFKASEEGKAFVKKAQGMGFRVMPHCNSIDMDPTNPADAFVRDFRYRNLVRKSIDGWSWHEGKSLFGPPRSNVAMLQHRDKKTMVKIHPGLGMWRSILTENVLKAVDDLTLEAVFLDVTLCTWNLHNCLVNDVTPTEGMVRLIEEVADLKEGLAVGGEGLNETTAQKSSFGQVHLFESSGPSVEGLERAGGCALNEFLFGRLCRTFGYSRLSGRTEDEELRMRIHEEHGAIPTITIGSAEELRKPNKVVKRILESAGA